MKQPKQPTYEKRETIPVKYQFNDAEMAELARKQGEIFQQKEVLDGQKKQMTKDFGARIESLEGQLADISNKTTSGYEYRPTECGVVLRPAEKEKDYFHGKTGLLVETRPMQLADFQKTLPFEEPKPKADAKPKPADNFPEDDAA